MMDELATTARPQCVILLAARFQAIAHKYESFAYSLMMKNVGVLMQTMYLVATAMDLAPTAIGNGDSEAFATATGLDPYVEGTVGEFSLGVRGK